MDNINILIGYTAYICMQAQLLLEKSEILSNSVRNLLIAGTAVGEHKPETFKINVDICSENKLLRGTDGVADVIIMLNDVLDDLITIVKKFEKDIEKINKQLGKKRMRDVNDDDDDDDDVAFT